MRLDFEQLNQNIVYDCCVIGTGPAGISCALELAKAGKNILLLEAGNDEVSEQSQDIYRGKVVGNPYLELDVSRLRFFGGSSNHWGGMCRTLDEYDFSNKGRFATCWPISKLDIDPYLKQASEILELQPIPADEAIGDSGLNRIHFVYSEPVRFLEKYLEFVIDDPNITLVFNANVTSIASDGKRITDVVIKNYADQSRAVHAKYFILATGGIENSRLLLWSNELGNNNVVKTPDALGKYWMEHLDFMIGSAVLSSGIKVERDKFNTFYMAPNEQSIIENDILNCGIRIQPRGYHGSKKLVADLMCVAPEVGRSFLDLFEQKLACGYMVRGAWEQEPVSSNCVKLGDEKDRFDIPRSELHWKWSDTDWHTPKKSMSLLGEYLVRSENGRVLLNSWLLNEDDYPLNDTIGGSHHMGGTRMADRAKDGIVDSNLKVFGQDNLYIAGSSVFPSGGHANPTLTIVQLALRLADHLKTRV